jgi:glycosyltransferase involved in cell wall biosynthesis
MSKRLDSPECPTHGADSLRIALDATPLTLPAGGLRRYAEQLALALAAEYPQDHLTLVSDQAICFASPSPNLSLRTATPASWLERRWWLIGLNRALAVERADVFHGLDFAVPYIKKRPSVMTIHDLSPWRDPAWNPQATRVRRRTPWLLRLGCATLVITPTESIRRELTARFAFPADRVVAIPLAADHLQPPAHKPQPGGYFLYVGMLERRKNLRTVLKAWRRAKSSIGVELVLAGPIRRREDRPPPEPGLTVLGEVAEDQLPKLYGGALAFVYPSLYEGFGLPVLEAMRCGVPVIASCDPALIEVSAGAAVHVPATDVEAWSAAMVRLANDESERNRRRHLGLARAAQFSWRNTARQTRAVYQEAVHRES